MRRPSAFYKAKPKKGKCEDTNDKLAKLINKALESALIKLRRNVKSDLRSELAYWASVPNLYDADECQQGAALNGRTNGDSGVTPRSTMSQQGGMRRALEPLLGDEAVRVIDDSSVDVTNNSDDCGLCASFGVPSCDSRRPLCLGMEEGAENYSLLTSRRGGPARNEDDYAALDSARMASVPTSPKHVMDCLAWVCSIGGWQRINSCMESMVNHWLFAVVSVLLVVTNGVWIGIETDYHACHLGDPAPAWYGRVDDLYCLAFLVELLMRIVVARWHFFFESDWHWNLFDTVVVGIQVVDALMSKLARGSQQINFGFVRMLRMLRLLRIMRLVRVLRLVGELRSMVSSIVGSFKPLFWGLVLFFILIYIVGVFFLQAVTDARLAHQDSADSQDSLLLVHYYGSLFTVVFSLWACISGGIQWAHMMAPLRTQVSSGLAVVFIMYIAFSLLAMLNVITAIFVETAIQSAKQDQDQFAVTSLLEWFEKHGCLVNGRLDWEVFNAKVKGNELDDLFFALRVEKAEAITLFELIDEDSSGSVTTKEFQRGWLRLNGPICHHKRVSERLASVEWPIEGPRLPYACAAPREAAGQAGWRTPQFDGQHQGDRRKGRHHVLGTSKDSTPIPPTGHQILQLKQRRHCASFATEPAHRVAETGIDRPSSS